MIIFRKFSACFSSWLSVQLEVREDSGDLQRVDEVGLARVAELPLVDLRRVDVGLLDDVQIRVGMVALDLGQDVVEANH
jgi:hypothetical protein